VDLLSRQEQLFKSTTSGRTWFFPKCPGVQPEGFGPFIKSNWIPGVL
jgi:hypothetical protein